MPRARPAVQALEAYVPPLEGRRGRVRLDFNENTLGFPDELPQLDPELLTTYPEYEPARRRLAEHLGVGPERLLLTNGSDEGLFVAAFTFVQPDVDTAVVSRPTFALIPHYLRLCQARLVEVPVHPDLSFDLEALEAALARGVKIGMFASPDNPTGGSLPVSRVERWLEGFPDTLIVLDEAYGEYHTESALPLLERYPNLLVCRTFSKAWGLAGLRLGVVVGHAAAIEWMKRVQSPYSVNSLAVKTLLGLLPHAGRVREQARRTVEVKQWALGEFRKRGYAVTPGAANFFLVWAGIDSSALCGFLREGGVLVRDRSHLPGMGGSVRVSVGSRREMERLLELLDDFRERRVALFDLGAPSGLDRLAQRRRLFLRREAGWAEWPEGSGSLEEPGLEGAVYVGANTEDLAAAVAAGCQAVGVATRQSAEALRQAGARWVVEKPDEVVGLWMLDWPR